MVYRTELTVYRSQSCFASFYLKEGRGCYVNAADLIPFPEGEGVHILRQQWMGTVPFIRLRGVKIRFPFYKGHASSGARSETGFVPIRSIRLSDHQYRLLAALLAD